MQKCLLPTRLCMQNVFMGVTYLCSKHKHYLYHSHCLSSTSAWNAAAFPTPCLPPLTALIRYVHSAFYKCLIHLRHRLTRKFLATTERRDEGLECCELSVNVEHCEVKVAGPHAMTWSRESGLKSWTLPFFPFLSTLLSCLTSYTCNRPLTSTSSLASKIVAERVPLSLSGLETEMYQLEQIAKWR